MINATEPGGQDAVVRISGLSQRYKSVVALDAVTLDLPPGQIVGLLGPDGVGKSTLLDLIAGARVLQDGSLDVLGGPMCDAAHRRRIGPRIAYMPQGLGKNLYQTLSVHENLTFFGQLFGQDRDEREARIERLTRATGLESFLDRPAGKLSGGMKQKLGLCCSLLHDPDLLILDEPTTGVDPLSRRQFWMLIDAIRAERMGMSVLVSTAYMDEADGFDWLVAMDAGRVIGTGTAAELKAQTGTKTLEEAFVRLLPDGAGDDTGPLEIPPLSDDGGAPAITARGLTKRFGDFTAVSDVSFDIRPGEIFGFLGSNGCGKTTTMKMLTGLLPASEGEAMLFGQPVDAHDMATRNRVGFMSQAFSLYGELTVSQNLWLHARLFKLKRGNASTRIDLMRDRFGLGSYMDKRADDLPLGLRQRLSLAVAVLHEPEVLILDEPTSGVDPVARDQFWELLVELSRNDGVTIFISTHFMNEAMRCDRISLMHAGQVLISDPPERIIEQSGYHTLEAAFIHYIEQASDTSAASQPTVLALGAATSEAASIDGLGRFSLKRLFALSHRETLEVLRDPIRLAFAVFGSAILLVVLSFGMGSEDAAAEFAVLDSDRTPASRAYVAALNASPDLTEVAPVLTLDALRDRLVTGEVDAGIEIPAGFGLDMALGRHTDIFTLVDGSNVDRGETVLASLEEAHTAWLADQQRQSYHVREQTVVGLDVSTRFLYNPNVEIMMAMGPAVPAILLMLFPAILMAVSVAREKEVGTITNFYVTPTNRVEFLLGKQLPYVALALFNFLLLTLIVTIGLDVPLKGSFLTLLAGSALFGFAATGFGLIVSSMVKNQVAAVTVASLLSVLPTVTYSGLVQPLSTMSATGQTIGAIWPASYYLNLSVGSYTKGLDLEYLWTDLVGLAVFGPVFLLIATLFLKKQER
ncbi:putative ABC transporter ATP-binding protein YbhF [Thalassovita gelatinovora]|uniref:Putative ABC transporter ATP-binding protein YbhF n=1 Tax=Thalassovita gelatinovora TaxID=53501 RepID=A0A0P1FT22_THAGE|nr:ribosome-associated ATPase/putative transporter RbbA [Thalassovita gelatinovora]QIZ80781.1 ribosome-associated ATPase/putative transporter RbbA [Thalassovita gelatinovora]CUH63157.1 putative ABC transporter ATP-binding protein YbhF [Thalassovita gelatinovora]SEQ62696.1 ribosome-dependent ATPase [Thalassovita gelatinovora]